MISGSFSTKTIYISPGELGTLAENAFNKLYSRTIPERKRAFKQLSTFLSIGGLVPPNHRVVAISDGVNYLGHEYLIVTLSEDQTNAQRNEGSPRQALSRSSTIQSGEEGEAKGEEVAYDGVADNDEGYHIAT